MGAQWVGRGPDPTPGSYVQRTPHGSRSLVRLSSVSIGETLRSVPFLSGRRSGIGNPKVPSNPDPSLPPRVPLEHSPSTSSLFSPHLVFLLSQLIPLSILFPQIFSYFSLPPMSRGPNTSPLPHSLILLLSYFPLPHSRRPYLSVPLSPPPPSSCPPPTFLPHFTPTSTVFLLSFFLSTLSLFPPLSSPSPRFCLFLLSFGSWVSLLNVDPLFRLTPYFLPSYSVLSSVLLRTFFRKDLVPPPVGRSPPTGNE